MTTQHLIVGDDAGLLAHPPVAWAVDRLRLAVEHRLPGVGSLELVLTSRAEDQAGSSPRAAESFELRIEAPEPARRRVTIDAADDRGYAYAITETAERVTAHGLAGLADGERIAESPAVPVRGIQRMFCSVQEDLAWFHDRGFWTDYLDHLAQQRFNRFQLGFGMQYNYGTGWESRTATDNYLCFVYPFLLDVPGYDVRAQGVDAAERARNLESLAFIARETTRRGMRFQLGLWNHAYDYAWDSPQWYPVLGVSADNHARYSADALSLLLTTIPEIGGLTVRVHHEGGIHEEGHEVFWGTVFDAVSAIGRPMEIDMHAKGVDQALIDAVQRPNLDPVISGKYWAEHMGLPYHQASIRDIERTALDYPGMKKSVTGVTHGERRFTRYGYGDFLAADRPVDFMFRMWPGTQKLLLWGDPAIAAGFGRYATIGGARGLEFCEPLFFKARKGTGSAAGRDVYARDDLALGVADWRKYEYTYLLWGRLLYNPDAEPEVWQRHLRARHGEGAADVEAALAPLSRILPLVTVAHGVSGANNFYWPEMYVDLAVSFWKQMSHYAFDTPEPRTWEGVSPFDPTMFYGIGEFADAVLAGEVGAKHTPLEVAAWIDEMVASGAAALERLGDVASSDAQTQRALIDARVLVELGRFFSGKFTAATAYAFFRRTGSLEAIERAVDDLTAAHAAYGRIPSIVEGVYRPDLAFGNAVSEHGTWADRLMAMREDAFLLRQERDTARRSGAAEGTRTVEIDSLRSSRPRVALDLNAPDAFEAGRPLTVRLDGSDARVTGATLYYRYLDQSRDYEQVEMRPDGAGFTADVPDSYTQSTFPIIVFAEVRLSDDDPVLVPAFDDDLSNQPYLVVAAPTTR